MTRKTEFSIATSSPFVGKVPGGSRARPRVTMAFVVDQGKGRHLGTTVNTVEIEGEAKPASIAETLEVGAGVA